MTNWISVKDRLPKQKQDIIAWGNGSVQLVYCDKDKFYDVYELRIVLNITHWQPLPEPPKEADDE